MMGSGFQRWELIYYMNVIVIAGLIFLHGFFPIKLSSGVVSSNRDIPTEINDIRLDVSKLYEARLKRLVVMVVDAMRFDFVKGADSGGAYMPYVAQLVADNEACLLKARVEPPTVTMPRIKAMTTGSDPNFVDIAINFGSTEMTDDSIIHQAANSGKRMVFYGDETWLKLFPNKFIRSEGTTSFFVTDYTEVDINVTRNVALELERTDWDWMILHYLGLDHIGHLQGPKSPLVRPKLLEMDTIARSIHHALQRTATKDGSTMLIVCGDHGMKDSGSHGGASPSEVIVPIVTIGYPCSSHHSVDMSQVDLAPTLSVLLGLPIPSGSVGRLAPAIFTMLSPLQYLYALYYNSKQVAHQFQLALPNSQDGLQEYEAAVQQHAAWLDSAGSAWNAVSDNATRLYSAALDTMSQQLTRAAVRYDVPQMVAAIFVLLQITVLLWQNTGVVAVDVRCSLLVAVFLLVGDIAWCRVSCSQSLLCSLTPVSVPLLLLLALLIGCNFSLLVGGGFALPQLHRNVEWVLMLGTVGQTLSLSSSSLIEEEHQVWYFLWASLLCCVLLYSRPGQTVAYLVMHRVLRSLNQTGDKWAHLPDLAGWLGNRPVCLSLLTFSGLICVAWLCNSFRAKRTGVTATVIALLTVASAACVYCYGAAKGKVLMYFIHYPQSRGISEVNMFVTLLSGLIAVQLVELVRDHKAMAAQGCTSLRKRLLDVLIVAWVLVTSLLHRPHNVLLPLSLVACGRLVPLLCGDNIVQMTVLHQWIGLVHYFYQGNSNSFANIDVASGYAGLDDYNLPHVVVLLTINTYAAPVLSYLLLLRNLAQRNETMRYQLVSVYWTEAILASLQISVYMIMLTAQRYHLFVWSVFSPKMLFLGAHYLVTFVLIWLTELSLQFARKLSSCL